MHMSDALISPVVGGGMIALSAAVLAVKTARSRKTLLSAPSEAGAPQVSVPSPAVVGVMSAFIFAAQMINFQIPGTGSSGHIVGGVLLAALLGSSPALLGVAAVLMVQCLFFADGGLIALGCNVFNMGVVSTCIAFPLFKPLMRRNTVLGATLACVFSMSVGSFCVVMETIFSGRTDLPFLPFTAAMIPIHLAIGLVEGLATAGILGFLEKARPELLHALAPPRSTHPLSTQCNHPSHAALPEWSVAGGRGLNGGNDLMRRSADCLHSPSPVLTASSGAAAQAHHRHKFPTLITLSVALIVAGGLSLVASGLPDGLEWSLERVGFLETTGNLMEKFAFFPDYENTTLAGIAGVGICFVLVGGVGLLAAFLRRKKREA